jgi:hypothetical protein
LVAPGVETVLIWVFIILKAIRSSENPYELRVQKVFIDAFLDKTWQLIEILLVLKIHQSNIFIVGPPVIKIFFKGHFK